MIAGFTGIFHDELLGRPNAILEYSGGPISGAFFVGVRQLMAMSKNIPWPLSWKFGKVAGW